MNFQTVLVVCGVILGAQLAAAQKKNVCYGNHVMPAHSIDPSICTHIIYSFVQVDANGNIVFYDNPQEIAIGYINQLVSFKNQYPNLKILVAFGGALGVPNSVWGQMTGNPAARNNFAHALNNFINTHNLDGVDMDWEYPNSDGASAPWEKDNYSQLMRDIRDVIGWGKLLTTAIGASPWRIDVSFDVVALFQICDFVNLMTYDFNGWQHPPFTAHNAPLYRSSVFAPGTDNYYNNVDHCVQSLLNRGVDRSKLIMGIPTYGKHFWVGWADGQGTGVNANFGGSPTYTSICQQINWGQLTRRYDYEQQVPFATGGDTWIGYEDVESATVKANYINTHGLGGAMFWSLDNDDYANACGGGNSPIIRAVKNIMGW